MPDGFAPVLQPKSEVELAFALGVLEGAGIPYFVHNGHFGALYLGPQVPLYNVRTILVPTESAVAARDYLSGLSGRGSLTKRQTASRDRARVLGEIVLFGWFVPGASARARP